MDNIQKIGRIEAIALALTVISNNIIFNMPTVIFNDSGSGSWLNVIYISILALIFFAVILKLSKPFSSFDLIDISKVTGGKFLACIIGILYSLLFIAFSAICVRYCTNNLHLIYFPEDTLLFLIIITFIPIIIASRIGLKAIYGTNLVVIPITILSIILLLATSAKNFTWQKLFPIFGYGAKELFINQSTNIFVFNIIGYLYFLPPFLKDSKDYKKVSIFSLITCSLYLLLSIISLTMAFSFSFKADESLSLYLLSRLISLGRFIQRIDAIFIFVWILAFLSFISFNVYLISYIIKKSFNLGESKELIFSISSIIIGVALLFKNASTTNLFVRNVYKPYAIILIFLISFIIILIAFLKKKFKRKVVK